VPLVNVTYLFGCVMSLMLTSLRQICHSYMLQSQILILPSDVDHELHKFPLIAAQKPDLSINDRLTANKAASDDDLSKHVIGCGKCE